MLSAFPAVFFKEELGYTVVFPDLNYLSTCGDTEEEALSMAVDCLAGYLYNANLDGEIIPRPSSPASLDIATLAQELEVDSEGSFVNVVTVDVQEYAKKHFEKAVKKTLTIPAWMNERALLSKIRTQGK